MKINVVVIRNRRRCRGLGDGIQTKTMTTGHRQRVVYRGRGG